MKKTILILLLIISNVVFALLYLDSLKQKASPTTKQAINEPADESDMYPLLSKRIFAESQNDILINFIPLRAAIKQYVAKQENELGIYFEYLPSGTSIGINDQLEVRSASLIKIPLAMAAYKEITEGRLKSDQLLTIDKKHLDKRFGTLWKKGEGTKLTVEEAIRFTLQESDNTAARLLVSHIDPRSMEKVFNALDIKVEVENSHLNLSPKSYSSFLRSLYLASYISKENSNHILDILTQTKFNDKIAGGVPTNVKVSHKIGVFDSKDTTEKIHSDCGIIYAPNRPYLLCIMAKAPEEKSNEYMQHLSKMVYGYITLVKGGN